MPLPILIEFKRYKAIVDKTLEQLSDAQLNHVPYPDGNSIAMIIRHLSGNLTSRFTDFLTSDGEKAWRNREQEFAEGVYDRKELMRNWEAAWAILMRAVESVELEAVNTFVIIRGITLTAEEALNRSASHIAYHAGQIVLLGRMYQGEDWEWITIPRGKSAEYNANPTMEKSLK